MSVRSKFQRYQKFLGDKNFWEVKYFGRSKFWGGQNVGEV